IKPVARGGNARAVGGSGVFPIVYGLLDSITIGEARIDAIPVYIRTIHTAPDTPQSERADGYIGLSVLANYAVTLDYQAKQMTLDRSPIREETDLRNKSDAAKPDGGANSDATITGDLVNGFEIPIRSTSGGLASAETHLPNLKRPLNFIIDTGATTTVI